MSLTSVLCVIAHPDDELFVAGLLAHFVKNNVDVHLLSLTRGGNGAPGLPALPADASLAEVRTSELTASARILGASSLTLLGYLDTLGPDNKLIMPEHDPEVLRRELVDRIKSCHAQVVITHGSEGEYGHPAHKGLHALAIEAAQQTEVELYGFQANFAGHTHSEYVNERDNADLIVNIAAYAESHLFPMFQCHQTQVSWWAHVTAKKLERPVTLKETWQRHVFSQPVVSLHQFLPATPSTALNTWLAAHPVEVA